MARQASRVSINQERRITPVSIPILPKSQKVHTNGNDMQKPVDLDRKPPFG